MNFDNIYYRLNDPGEIRLCILLCIRYAGEPLSDGDIKHIMLSSTSVEFIDLCDALDKLLPENYTKNVWRDEVEKLDLTQQGIEMIDVFDDKITASVRASIKRTIDEYLNREGPKTQVKCIVTPAERNLYNVEVEITEGKTTLLSMTVFTGNKEKAARYAKGFRKNPMELYTKVIESLANLADDAEKENE
ncbi:MAG: DUF4364 family protein [Clostridia bacterium]|nr:DUF4364 family protein [Clostridia bacterium]